MANNLLFFTFLFFIFCDASIYKNYSLDNSEICPFSFKTPEVVVGRENRSALIIRDGNLFKRWKGDTLFECKFTVTSGFSSVGLLAVVQNMVLRRNATTGECIDYIKFNIKKKSPLEKIFPVDTHPKRWNEITKICGTFNKLSLHDKDLSGNISELSVKNIRGEIGVMIHIARKAVLDVPPAIEIAFTAFIECKQGSGPFRYCGDQICIYKTYFKDRIINCPYPICADESSCDASDADDMDERELSTRVTVTAVTSIFMSFFLFLGCMLLCRYCLLFPQWHRPVAVEMEPTPPPPHVPSAPPAQPHDKDLPPAYETLFPDK